MFVACGIRCLADVSSVSPSSEQSIFSALAHAEKQFFSKLVFNCINSQILIDITVSSERYNQ